jgi:hypothetical protein
MNSLTAFVSEVIQLLQSNLPDSACTKPVFPDVRNASNMTFHWWIFGVSCFALSKGACIWRITILVNGIEARSWWSLRGRTPPLLCVLQCSGAGTCTYVGADLTEISAAGSSAENDCVKEGAGGGGT